MRDQQFSSEFVLVIDGMEEDCVILDGFAWDSSGPIWGEWLALRNSTERLHEATGSHVQLFHLEHFHGANDIGEECECAQYAQSHLPEIEFYSHDDEDCDHCAELATF